MFTTITAISLYSSYKTVVVAILPKSHHSVFWGGLRSYSRSWSLDAASWLLITTDPCRYWPSLRGQLCCVSASELVSTGAYGSVAGLIAASDPLLCFSLVWRIGRSSVLWASGASSAHWKHHCWRIEFSGFLDGDWWQRRRSLKSRSPRYCRAGRKSSHRWH